MPVLFFFVFVFIAILFVAPLLGVVFGAFSGWLISCFFNDPVHNVVVSLLPSLAQYTLAEIGAGLGFLGGFFRSVTTQKTGS